MSVIQVSFNPAIWTAGFGTAGQPGANGFNAFTVVNDPDGVTGWAFEYFGGGFARFNLTTGSIVHQDALKGVSGFTNFLYQREDGTGMFVPSDDGHYYTIPTLGASSTTLYKSHLGAGTPGNLFNAYMIDDATLDTKTLMSDNAFGIDVYNWNTPISQASDTNRYLAVANNYLSFGVFNVGTMAATGQWSCVYPNATAFPVIGTISNLNVTSVTGPVLGVYSVNFTLTGTFTSLTAGDVVSFSGISDANFAWMNAYSFPVTSGNGTTIVVSASVSEAPVVHNGAATGTVYISRTPKSWTTFMDKNGDFWGLFSLGTVTYTEDTSLNHGAVLVHWHPADGVFDPGPFGGGAFHITACTHVAGGGAQILAGTIAGGGSNALAGSWFTVSGFVNGGNNGTFLCTASTTTHIILQNFNSVTESHSANALALPRLNATPHFVTAATMGTGANGINFGAYVASNHSVFIGNTDNTTNGGWDGQTINIDLNTFARNALHANDGTFFYSGTFDLPESMLDIGVQACGMMIPGDVNPHVANSHLGGVLNFIDPAALSLTQSLDATDAVLTGGFLAGGTFNDFHSGHTVYCPMANVAYSHANSVAAMTYEFVGSAVYLVSFAEPCTPPVPGIFAQALPSTIVGGEHQSSNLTWASTNATIVNIDHGIGNMELSGSLLVTPTSSTTYTFTAIGAGGTATTTVEVIVTSPEARFNLQKLILTLKQEPMTPVRGRGGSGGK